MTDWPTFPRETDEWIPWAVTVDGVPTTVGVSFAVVEDGTRPDTDDWQAAEVRTFEGAPTTGFIIAALTPGRYRLFARGTGTGGRKPVIDCGIIHIT